MPNSVPNLLKFCSATEHSLKNLERAEIFCQHYSAYNDPFEFWSKIYEGAPDSASEPDRFLAALKAWGMECCSPDNEDLIAYFDECTDYQPPFRDMRENIRIACFGSQPDNLLMWSHYADGLRGFCIVFDENVIVEAEPECHIVDVAYLDAPPTLDSFVYAISQDQHWYHQMAVEEIETRILHSGQTNEANWIADYRQVGAEALRKMRETFQLVLAAKPKEWKYERERRLLVQGAGSDAAPILRPYPREAVKKVILGERMTEEYRRKVLGVMKTHYPIVPVSTARRSENLYALIID